MGHPPGASGTQWAPAHSKEPRFARNGQAPAEGLDPDSGANLFDKAAGQDQPARAAEIILDAVEARTGGPGF